MSFSLNQLSKCVPLSFRLESRLMSSARSFNFRRPMVKFAFGGTASALLLLSMSSVNCAADEDSVSSSSKKDTIKTKTVGQSIIGNDDT